MTSKTTILSLVTLLVAAFGSADASYAPRTPSHDQPCIVLQISDLRSAWLLRAGAVRYDESNRTSDGLRQQLQRHFDVVLSLLSAATPDSIETAVARLEAADDHSWTAGERNAWRQKLLAARLVQLRRLAAYRDRGIFPLNEGQSAHPAPIFVDRHGTACAVGHLMRCSGWTDAVDSIAQSNNLVYVPDAARSGVATWVLTSGLTFEEAALIQPGYYWAAGQFDASTYQLGELALEKDGLRFSNFSLQAQNYSEPSGEPLDFGAKPTLAGLGLSAGKGTYTYPFGYPQHVPIGTHWIAIGGTAAYSQTPLHSLNASAASRRGQIVVIDFDVTPIATDQWINGISESSYSYWQGFQNVGLTDVPPPTAIYYLKTTALDGGTNLATVNVDQSAPGPYFSRRSDTRSFAATRQISVETQLWLRDGVAIDTYLLDFNVVPEPASACLAAVAVAAFGLTRTRGQVR